MEQRQLTVHAEIMVHARGVGETGNIRTRNGKNLQRIKNMNKIYTKTIESCVQCPYFWGEGEFCKHPDRGGVNHVVYSYHIPDDCPLTEELPRQATLTFNLQEE